MTRIISSVAGPKDEARQIVILGILTDSENTQSHFSHLWSDHLASSRGNDRPEDCFPSTIFWERTKVGVPTARPPSNEFDSDPFLTLEQRQYICWKILGSDMYCDISSLVVRYMCVHVVQLYVIISCDDVILRWQCESS